MLTSTTPTTGASSLMKGVLHAQTLNSTLSGEALARAATGIAALACAERGRLLASGEGGERIIGAALAGSPDLPLVNLSHKLDGEHVLLVAGYLAGPHQVLEAAARMRALGAHRVDATGLGEWTWTTGGLDHYWDLLASAEKSESAQGMAELKVSPRVGADPIRLHAALRYWEHEMNEGRIEWTHTATEAVEGTGLHYGMVATSARKVVEVRLVRLCSYCPGEMVCPIFTRLEAERALTGEAVCRDCFEQAMEATVEARRSLLHNQRDRSELPYILTSLSPKELAALAALVNPAGRPAVRAGQALRFLMPPEEAVSLVEKALALGLVSVHNSAQVVHYSYDTKTIECEPLKAMLFDPSGTLSRLITLALEAGTDLEAPKGSKEWG